MKTIAERIKEIREDRKWTQEDAASLLGLSKRGYQDRERKGEFPLADIVTLADAFNVSIDYMLTGKDGRGDLTEDQQRLLRGWSKIGIEDKNSILSLINDALQELIEKN